MPKRRETLLWVDFQGFANFHLNFFCSSDDFCNNSSLNALLAIAIDWCKADDLEESDCWTKEWEKQSCWNFVMIQQGVTHVVGDKQGR